MIDPIGNTPKVSARDAAVGSLDGAIAWLNERPPAREIEKFLHKCRMEGGGTEKFQLGKIALDIRLAEDAEKTSRRIIWLTVALLAFTVALFAVEVRAVFFPQDSSTHPKTEQTGQNH